MFQLQGAIIRPLYIRTDPYLVFSVQLGSKLFIVHYWSTVVYSVLVWLKIRLKWKTMENCAKIYYKT